jgi:hypothetical protein
MGGYNSGRTGGRPTADMSKRIDIAWLIRTRRAIPGRLVSGTLEWFRNGEPVGAIGYQADMRDEEHAELRLTYSRGSDEKREEVQQKISLTFTTPNYGGRRWWMICPYRHNRCGKLYMPNWGDRFAGRQAWRLGYACQRLAHRDRPFEKLFRLQRKLGCDEGVYRTIRRPKGMWQKTFDRYRNRYDELIEECEGKLDMMFARLEIIGWSPDQLN